MSIKILIADDSVTIQKVVNIMLANEPYELTQCDNEKDLFNICLGCDYDLILLDYNFSEKFSGSDLIKKIISFKEDVKIMVMLGTFDSVDSVELRALGAKDTIVKPFESAVFLKKCQALVGEIDTNEDVVTPDEEEISLNDGWTVSAPVVQDLSAKEEIEDEIEPNKVSDLQGEISSWGMNIPNVIGENESVVASQEIPDIISQDSNSVLPDGDNLEYPDNDTSSKNVSSTMLPIENLNLNLDLDLLEEEDNNYDTTEEIVLSQLKTEAWEKEISDEQKDDDFWHGDDDLKNNSDNSVNDIFKVVPEISEENNKLDDQVVIEQDESDLIENDQSLNETSEFNESIFKEKVKEIITVHYEQEIIEKVKEHMGPMLEKYVHDYCKETIEKVAWEIIPDLAENLIKKELKSITDSISETD